MHHPILRSDFDYPFLFLLLGVLLLLFGRSLFWLFVAVAGFLIGVEAAPMILPHQGELFTLLVAGVLGLLGALLAIFVQKLAIGVGGFIAGGYLAIALCDSIQIAGRPTEWLAFLVGGILGAILMVVFFNWTLIFLSSFEGAHLIVRGLPVIRGFTAHRSRHLSYHYPILFIVLAVIGIVFQASAIGRRRVKAE